MTSEPQNNADRLDSWKAIANYLGKTVRTVQRWEQQEGLPVRRIHHQGGSSVYAFRHELDRWVTLQNLVVHDRAPAAAETPERSAATETVHAMAEQGTPASTAPVAATSPSARRPGRFALALAVLTVAGLSAWWLSRPGDSPAEPGATLVPVNLTTEPGEERFPTLSPDGRQVAYVWTGTAGQADLFLRLVEVSEHLQLTDDAAIEESPRWSPDGLSLAYLKRTGPARRGLFVVAAIGGSQRQLFEFPVPASMDSARSMSPGLDWSPDGRSIVFTEGAEGSEAMRLAEYDLETGQRRALTEFAGDRQDHAPAWSPDGRHLAFARNTSSLLGSLQVIDVETARGGDGAPRSLPAASDWNSEPEWSVDGRSLVFSSGRWPNTRLWQVSADGLGVPVPLAGPGPGASQASISPVIEGRAPTDAWRLVYRVLALENDIWRIDLSGQAADAPLVVSSQRDRFPAFAPDGRFAFLSDRSGDREIWVARADGSDPQQWTRWRSSYVWRPSFSPDGQTLAYIVEVDGRLQAWLQEGPLAPPRALRDGEAAELDLAWSRDGRTLHVQIGETNRTAAGIEAVPVGGGPAALILEGEYVPLGEDPEGRRLFYFGPADGRTGLWSRAHDTGQVERIALRGDRFHSYALGPDGVYFVADADGRLAIHRWDWASGVQTELRTLDHRPEIGMTISPDGREALLARIVLQRGDLMVASMAPVSTH